MKTVRSLKLNALLVSGFFVFSASASCSTSVELAQRTVKEIAVGTWDCTTNGGQETVVIGEGTFEIRTGPQSVEDSGSWNLSGGQLLIVPNKPTNFDNITVLNVPEHAAEAIPVKVEYPWYSQPRGDPIRQDIVTFSFDTATLRYQFHDEPVVCTKR